MRKRDWLRAVSWVVMLPVLFVMIAAVLTIDRDITAPSWLRNRIEARAADILGGGSLVFGEMTLRIGRDLHPRVVMHDTMLRDADNAPLARIARVSGLISPRGVIFEQAALMQVVSLQGARIALNRASDGTVAIRFNLAGQDAQVAGGLPELMEQLDNIFDRPALAALERIEVEGLVVNYADSRAGRNWTVDGGRLALDLREAQTRLSADFAVLSGGAGVTTLELAFESPRKSHEADIRLRIDNVNSGELASQSAALNWLGAIDAPLSAQLETRLDAEGEVSIVSAELDIGTGVLRPAGSGGELGFETARAELEFDPVMQKLTFKDVAILSDRGSLRSSGQALLKDIVGGLPQELLGQFSFSEIVLQPREKDGEVRVLEAAHVDLRVRLAPFSVEVGQAVFLDETLPLTFRGHFSATPAGWHIASDLEVKSLDRDQLFALWPETQLAGTRKWLSENLLRGTIRDMRVGYRTSPGQPAQVASSFRFENTNMNFLPDMPPVQRGGGFAQIANGAFDLFLDEGQVLAPQGGSINLSGSSLRIPELAKSPRQMQITFDAVSTITAAFAVLDQPPVRLMQRIRQPITLADGSARTMGRLEFPLKSVITGPEVRYQINSELSQVHSEALVPERMLTSPALVVDVDNQGVEVAGTAFVDGVRFRGRFRQDFPPGQDRIARVNATMDLSADGLSALGVDLPDGLVGGEGIGEVALEFAAGLPPSYALNSDVRGISFAIPAIGWSKPAAETGRLTLAGKLGSPPSVDRLSVEAGGMRAEGRISMRPEGGLDAARFSRVRIGDWLDAPITLRGRGRGRAPAVDIAGGAIDLRRARFGQGGGQGGPVNLRLERLQLAGGLALTDFVGEFDGREGFSGQFSARINRGAAVRGTVVPQEGRSAVRLLSDDAGGVIAAAGFIKNAIGGTLDLTLRPVASAGTFDGQLSVRGIRIRDAPSIAALLDAISVVGLLQQLDGQGLAFEEVDARFRLSPTQIILTEASAVGPGLGISLDGLYTLATKQLEFQGVISPFYLINSIGSVLTRRGEGLIGFNFTLEGTAGSPEVNVNPLSALTPGMFREIFRKPPPVVAE